jgi:hypothetical protein
VRAAVDAAERRKLLRFIMSYSRKRIKTLTVPVENLETSGDTELYCAPGSTIFLIG